jgi:hypothetical protein
MFTNGGLSQSQSYRTVMKTKILGTSKRIAGELAAALQLQQVLQVSFHVCHLFYIAVSGKTV